MSAVERIDAPDAPTEGTPDVDLAFKTEASAVPPRHAYSLTKLVASLYRSHTISDADLDDLAKFIEEKTGGA